VWDRAIDSQDDGWTCEVRFPLSAFYMTRNGIWSTKWRLNLARNYVGESGEGGGEISCWGDVETLFAELKGFRELDGFPVRRIEEDIFIKTVTPDVRSVEGDRLKGAFKFAAYVAKGGDFTVTSDRFPPTKVTLTEGDNEFEVASDLPPNGKSQERFGLVRLTDGTTVARSYPVVVDYQPIRVKLTTPQYRGNFYPGQCADKVVGEVRTLGGAPVELTLEGPGFGARTQKLAKGGGTFAFDTTGFAYGDARLTVRCGQDVFEKKIRRLAPLPEGRHMSWIENGNLVVDGKPVFRRNVYATGFMGGRAFKQRFWADDLHLTKAITEIAEFDPGPLRNGEAQKDQMPSKKMFEKVDAGLKLGLGNSKGAYYYSVDEPEQHNLSPVYLKHIYDYVAEKDPYHVILSCSRSGKYIDVADWFEVHPYINPHYNAEGERVYSEDFNRLGACVDSFRPEEHPDKCVGGTPTCFAYGSGDYPTFDEYELNYWCELVRGAKTMFPYAYHDIGDRTALYEGTRYLFESLEALEPVPLHGRRQTLAKTQTYECALWTMPDGERLFALLNFTGKPQTVKVPGLTGSFREFRGARTFELKAGDEIALKPFESLVAGNRSRGAALKSRAQQVKDIAALEYARTHRGNQLLGKHWMLDVKTSTGKRGAWRNDAIKLFDGILDVIAWSDPKVRTENKFFEMGFKRFPVTFGKLSVWGTEMDGLSLKVLVGGIWKHLVPASVEKDGMRITFTFAGKQTPEGLRLEFPKDRDVEIYEIEL